jgi:rod shape-determining protein MreC
MMDDGKKQKGRFSADALVFLVLTLASFLTLYFSNSSFVVDFKDVGLSFFLGSRNVIHEVTSFVSRTVLSIGELANLRREYAELTNRMMRYEQLERSAAEIRQENRRLREQLDFSQSLGYKHIPAELIGRDPDNLFSAFVINKGSLAGVAVDMPVIAYQNGMQGLVGKVVQTAQFESMVMPLYDVSSYVSARLAELRFEGIVEGQGSPETPMLMRFINKRARNEISQGDVIITSGMGRVFPTGITIGRVGRILFQEYESSMEVELEPAIDFSRLEYIFVLDPSSVEMLEPSESLESPNPEQKPEHGDG